MEMVGGFVDEEWESLTKMFSGGDTPECDGATLFPLAGEFPFMAFSETNFCSISQESSNERSLFCNEDDHHQQFVEDHNNASSLSFFNNGGAGNLMMMMPVFSDDAMEEILNSNEEIKRKYENLSPEISPKKTPRLSRNVSTHI